MKILLVAIYFPPMNNSASIRSLYYANYLKRLGHKVGVLTCRYNEDHIYYDKGLEERVDEGIKIYRDSAGYLYSKTYSRKGASTEAASPGLSAFVRFKTILKNYVAIPDSFMVWKKNAAKTAKRLVEEGEYDVVFSMHELPSSHLVACSVKKRFPQIRWAAYWSDPWTVQNSARNAQPLLRKLCERRMEKSVVNKADLCLFTSEQTKDMYIDEFALERGKTGMAHRGYDSGDYEKIMKSGAPEGIMRDKVNMVHTGAIYTQLRDVNPFIDAIRLIKSGSPEVYERLNIVLIGEIDNSANIQPFEDLDVVSFRKRAPFEEAMRYMTFSDINILWGNKASSQIPGKVYEYMGANGCILTILGDECDPLVGIMTEADRGPIVKNTSAELYAAIIEIVRLMDAGATPSSWNSRNEKYEWKNVVRDLADKLAAKS